MKKFSIVLLISIVFLMSGCSITSTNHQSEKDKAKLEEQVRLKNFTDSITKLATQNSIKDVYMVNEEELSVKFSYEIQEEIGNKSVGFLSSIKDIVIKDNKKYIYLESFYPKFTYILEISNSTVNKIKSYNIKPPEYTFDSEIYVLATISYIGRASYEVSASGNMEDGFDLDIDGSKTIIIKGKCIDVLKP